MRGNPSSCDDTEIRTHIPESEGIGRDYQLNHRGVDFFLLLSKIRTSFHPEFWGKGNVPRKLCSDHMPLDFLKFVAAIFLVEFEICCIEFEICCSYSWIELTTALPVVALPNVVSVNQNQHYILPVIPYDRVLAKTDCHGKTAYKIL